MEHMIMGFNNDDYFSTVPFVHGVVVKARRLSKNDDGSFWGDVNIDMSTGERTWRRVLSAHLTPYLGEIV